MNRHNILKNLVEFSKPITDLSNDLSNLNWDYEGDPFTIYTYQILDVLNRHISGNLSSHEIENWANLIESREDIVFEKDKENILENIIHRLANPVLEGEITPDLSKEFILKIMNSQKEKNEKKDKSETNHPKAKTD